MADSASFLDNQSGCPVAFMAVHGVGVRPVSSPCCPATYLGDELGEGSHPGLGSPDPWGVVNSNRTVCGVPVLVTVPPVCPVLQAGGSVTGKGGPG